MPAEPPAVELVDRPTLGRTVTRSRPVRLGDVDERGRLRFDAIARYLQDIATDDSSSTELGDPFGWVVRRTLVDVRRAAGLDEPLELTTFCSGIGRSWAERRTSITGARGAVIEAVSLWIRVDPTSGRPTGLDDRFLDVHGSAARDRRVSTRLRLPPPPVDVECEPWPVRRVDLDPLRHVNNAAQWAIVEQTLPAGSRRGCAEIEHLSPVAPETRLELASCIGADGSTSSWLLADGAVLTAARWCPAT
jgi:acyl-ACP thioesterase